MTIRSWTRTSPRRSKGLLASGVASSNAHRVINGIGLVNELHYDSVTDDYLPMDYRVWTSEQDGKSKHDRVRELFLTEEVLQQGQFVWLRTFFGWMKVFWIVCPCADATEGDQFYVTNHLALEDVEEAKTILDY